MARISTYALDNSISDGDKLIGTDADNNNITKNFTLSGVAEYVIDKLIDPDATDFHIPVFNQNGIRITDSIMHQDSSVSNGVAGTKITIAGDLTLERDQSDTTLTLISDSSNIGPGGEQHNPSIKFIQDGGAQNAAVGFNIIDDTAGGTLPGTGNRFWIVNAMDDTVGAGGITFGTAQVDGWENSIARFMIRGDGKGLFGHPNENYGGAFDAQFEVYDDRTENTTTDFSLVSYGYVDISEYPPSQGAGGIVSRVKVVDGATDLGTHEIGLVAGTTSSELMTTGKLSFYSNSDLDTSGATGFSGFSTHDGTNPHWQLGGKVGDAAPVTTLKVVGTGEFTDQLTIPETPIAGTDAASKSYVDTLVTGSLQFKGTFRADTGEIISGTNDGNFLYSCPGGAGSRVAVAVGDYYIVSTAGGQFYCSGDLLQVGDSIVASSDAAADSSTLNDWGILEGNNVEGSGTENTIPLWTDNQVLGNSALSQEAGTAYNTSQNLVVRGNIYQSNMGQSVSIGEGALENGSSAVFIAENVAIGQNALNSLTTATNNIGIGASTLQNTNSNNNIAIGKNSQISQTAGLGNISLGFNSLSGTNVGNTNIAIGHTAMQNVVTGAQGITGNVILGANAVSATTLTGGLSDNVIIGIDALEESDAARISSGVFIGMIAGKFMKADAYKDIGIGFGAFFGSNNGFNSAGDNIAIGANANGANVQTGVRRSIKIGSDAGTAGSYAVNVSAVNTNSYSPNYVLGEHAATIGGANNEIQGAEAAFTGGGRNNIIASGAIGGAILGGYDNTVTASGSAGMALGSNLTIQGNNQVVVGRYNVGNNNSKLIVGAGFSNANRINAFEVKNTSQLKLGKYGVDEFLQVGDSYNLLVVGPQGNVNEVPGANLNPQNLEASSYTLNPAQIYNLPADSSTRLVKISWGSVNNGTAILRIPRAVNFPNKTIQIITDGTFDAGAGKKITIEGSFGAGDTIDGNASFELSKKYEGVTLWSDSTEWFVIQAKAH